MFVPGSTDPGRLDGAMRASLADSLDYILGAVGGRLDASIDGVRPGIAAIRAHRVVPGVFGLYYKLVVAIRAGAYGQAGALLSRLASAAGTEPAFGAGPYDEAFLGADRQLYGDLIDPEPGGSPWICPPASAPGFERLVLDALDLLAAADPPLAAELRGLLVQVVGAVPFGGPGARPFGSASSFMLWGLAVVNMQRYRTAADMVGGLVHEAAHLLLFAHSIEEPLVTNPIEERFTSPLRQDPRPMDGVFHATFVAARLHWARRMQRDAAGGTGPPDVAAALDSQLAELRRLYFGGLQTVQAHARLTATGRRILEETLDYMQAA